MIEPERILRGETAPKELLEIIGEIADAGVPAGIAARAVAMIQEGRPIWEAADLCLALRDVNEILAERRRDLVDATRARV